MSYISSDVACPLPPNIPVNNDYQEITDAQVWWQKQRKYGQSWFKLKRQNILNPVEIISNDTNSFHRAKSLQPAFHIHLEPSARLCLMHPFHNQIFLTTTTQLSGNWSMVVSAVIYVHTFRYECGPARRLVSDTGEHIKLWNITCQWNKTWSPAPELPVCDWVLYWTCLRISQFQFRF